MKASVSELLIRAFKARGVRRMFGVPGGGSSLDLIDQARSKGFDFVLTRHECSAMFMASATAELNAALGVALTTKGPGAANAANGAAHAMLDRCPVALLTDGFSPAIRQYVTHQWFDQDALLAPITKGHSCLDTAQAGDDVARLLRVADTPRRGPVHFELTGPAARAQWPQSAPQPRPVGTERPLKRQSKEQQSTQQQSTPHQPNPAFDKFCRRLASAKRPVMVIGLEACDAGVAPLLAKLARRLKVAVFVTYKAKGVIADDSPAYVGLFTGGAAEQPVIERSDLILLIGMDPVGLILQPWPYSVAVIELSYTRFETHYVQPEMSLQGDLQSLLASVNEGLADLDCNSQWSTPEIRHARQMMRTALEYRGTGAGLAPTEVVELAAQAALELERWPVVTVDAGAHMFSATALWPCHRPRDLLISNGLATMGFALPAAIAAALHQPKRPVIAFTGDGGLLMCLGELATAVQMRAKVIVIVFNDESLSLIDIKQQSRRLKTAGVRFASTDFAGIMRSVGGRGFRVSSSAAYRRALAEALSVDGPALIDVRVDPSGYPEQLKALRG